MSARSDGNIGVTYSGSLLGLVFLAGTLAYAEIAPTSYRIETRTAAGGEFLLALPPQYKPGDCPCLVVCLHGTNTDAGDILSFWLTMDLPHPMIFVAPQSSGKGWRDTDAARVFAAVEWGRQHLSADWSRVLLTGHSAGGTMAFHLVYERNFPATAAATTANYLPPSVTCAMIRRRSDLPVYYAVGTHDINRQRMRAGILLLRSNGTSVTVHRPDIGHVLDRDATQRGLDFFVEQNSRHVRGTIRQALSHFTENRPAIAVSLLQPVLDNAIYHIPDDVAEVEAAMDRIEQPGRKQLAQAESLMAEKQFRAALNLVGSVENRYADGRLARQCRKLRQKLLAQHPELGENAPPSLDPEKTAKRLLDTALQLTRERKFKQAKQKCRILLAEYQETRSAAGARRLLGQLELHTGP